MTTALFTHPVCLEHDTGPGHPEQIARLRVILEALTDERFALLDRREAPMAGRDALIRAHHAAYVDQALAAIPKECRESSAAPRGRRRARTSRSTCRAPP